MLPAVKQKKHLGAAAPSSDGLRIVHHVETKPSVPPNTLPHNDAAIPAWEAGGCLPGPLQHAAHPPCPATFHLESNGAQSESASEPWTHRPYCPDPEPDAEHKTTAYCVFTDATFRRGRGLSVIAPAPGPDTGTAATDSGLARAVGQALAAATASSARASASDYSEENGDTPAPYAVQPIPGKGLGLVATRRIRRGSVLMVDGAAVLAGAAFPGRVRRATGQELLAAAIDRLSSPEEVLGLARSRDYAGGAGADAVGRNVDVDVRVAEDVVKTNSFSVEVGGVAVMALFPRIARINHACNPSALTNFNESTLANTVTAFRDIDVGEEITISYSDFGLASTERKRILLQKWGFQCSCALCSADADTLAASDARRTEMRATGQRVLQRVEAGDFAAAVALNGALVAAVAEEKLVPHLGDHFDVMARLCLAAGDAEGAAKYARKAIAELKGFYQGAEAEGLAVRDLEALVTRLKRP
ncbi:hypothetical protein B0T26DRAFT_679823 [Lasiosphaeria miniovina]|uniref:SET domain-containing protein n=1 Tax=Lasiosphaeria miniovina TaxID=1954250 RepID=A0AA39ZYP5_9PEZI|nr:uncharacterized protein B0T26DRAFT_679823 [Lasiosphaeria miniovina]KAK0706096.1 hypothetical protein B0T26DRAFT_679823 [Lasiosphaeria miniovina]